MGTVNKKTCPKSACDQRGWIKIAQIPQKDQSYFAETKICFFDHFLLSFYCKTVCLQRLNFSYIIIVNACLSLSSEQQTPILKYVGVVKFTVREILIEKTLFHGTGKIDSL